MWIRLKSIQHIERNGKLHTYHPGDWVDVGKQSAMLWMSRGDAEIPSYKRDQFIAGEAGVIIKAESIEPYTLIFEQAKLILTLVTGEPNIAFNKTMAWDPHAPLRTELISAGFGFLDTWEIACPLFSYDRLAIHTGSEAERAKTQAVIRDLRVPMYDTRLIFVRNCENTKRLFDQWLNEKDAGGDEQLSFMRAFYAVKPLMLALPITWTQPHAYADAA